MVSAMALGGVAGTQQTAQTKVEIVRPGEVVKNALVDAQTPARHAGDSSISTSRQRRSGPTGASALQCGASSAASASPKVAPWLRDSPVAIRT